MDTRTSLFRLLAVLTAFGISLGGGAVLAEGQVHSFNVVDTDGIYYGEGSHPKAPGTIRADEVWIAIPEYKKIVDEDLSEDDPKYHLLMKKATERFQKALGKVAKRESYDMVGEDGSIEAVGEVKKEIPDATDDLVDAVGRD